ncbi:hypothetical protein SYNPS1DRAFT_27050 [Syncephalis pseudoplumigaleata]|uniref:Zn(2)-C6 fungal-type domain-containing protein n=1 Tax=Syncephalis pseudoplumigaleata TaxID=1712513 RepID=A0A4P9Z4E7_9FUNG|nr:hypothetical protein SYNPS1DRAFT_27050 [Syncephalis pseudoplumigaleata]|eukprot:RKP27288.1 hypothetical protein SYNPS1DRAFT_27050 [Syncephalis pseudoplumigaleata]
MQKSTHHTARLHHRDNASRGHGVGLPLNPSMSRPLFPLANAGATSELPCGQRKDSHACHSASSLPTTTTATTTKQTSHRPILPRTDSSMASIVEEGQTSGSTISIVGLPSTTAATEPDQLPGACTQQHEASSTTTANSQHKRPRNRRAFSCDMCRRRKIRCDQRRPQCGSCINRRVTCVYGAAEVGAFVAVLKTITRKIQRRRQSSRARAAASQPAKEAAAAAGAAATANPAKLDAEALSSLAKSLIRSISQQETMPLPSPTTEHYPATSITASDIAPVSFTSVLPLQHIHFPTSPPTSPAVYPVADEWRHEHTPVELTPACGSTTDGDSPSPMLLATVVDDESDSNDDGDGDNRSSAALVKTLQKVILSPSVTAASFQCPDPAVVQHLITIYVRRTHPQMPLFSLSWLNGMLSGNAIPPGLLSAIMALGARFSRELARSTEIASLLNRQARLFLQQSLDQPDVTTIQTALLTSLYFYLEGNGPMAFAGQSLSFRLCKTVYSKGQRPSSMALTDGSPGATPARAYQHIVDYDETWRRTWWYTFMANRFSSSRTGQSFGEHFACLDIPMPTEEYADMVGAIVGAAGREACVNAKKKYYPEFDGPVHASAGMTRLAGQQHDDIIAKYRYSHVFNLVQLLERIVRFTREVAAWSSCTAEQKRQLIMQQRRLQYEWCCAAKSLASFKEVYASLQALQADRLRRSSIEKMGAPMVAARPLPTSASIPAPMLMPPEETQAVSVDLAATLYSVLLHALHRTLLIKLMSPPMSAAAHAPQTDECCNIRALFNESLNKNSAQSKNAPPMTTTTDLEPLSMCLGAALEIAQIAEHVTIDAIAILHGYYQQSLGIAAEVFLDVIEDESAWQLMDPVACITRFAQLLDTLGRYSSFYAMAELHRVNMLTRFWDKCRAGIERLRATPGGVQLLQSPALQRARYPGTAWDPNMMAKFGI